MIAATHIDIIFKNYYEEFKLYITDIFESEHEIEVYSECLHPTLKRGWNGDLIYHTVRACDVPSGNPIDDDVNLVTIKDVLLRNVQCFRVGNGDLTEWKYVFLKD